MNRLEQVLKEYQNADRVKRDSMWCRFPSLRSAFDDIEHDGNGRAPTSVPSQSPTVVEAEKLSSGDALGRRRFPKERSLLWPASAY